MIAPIVKTRGIILKARGCNSFHGHISATIVRRIPTFPFPKPCRALATKAIGSDVENPHMSVVTMVLLRPTRTTVFRPYRSDAAPQGIPVRAWETEKMAEVRPAQRAISFSGTPKLSIISGR
jgi:hypothetical protein